MGNAKHTPGPWAINSADPLLFGRKQGDGIEPIGFVYGPAFTELSAVGKRAIANARLIAAAPDLLEALRGVCRWLPVYPKSAEGLAGGHAAYDAAVDAARAAIEKATGEAA